MASQALVEPQVDDGASLLAALDAANLPIHAAFWLYSSDWGEWRLMIASPLVDQGGPRKTYKRVQDALRKLPGVHIRLDQITVVGLKHPMVSALRSAISTGPAITTIRLTNNLFNGVLIEDAILYRSN